MKSIFSSSLRSSEISVVLSANDDGDDGLSFSNDAIVTTGEDSGFDYDIVRRRGPDAP